MIPAVDSSILLDVIFDDPAHARASAAALRKARAQEARDFGMHHCGSWPGSGRRAVDRLSARLGDSLFTFHASKRNAGQ
jgi:hypothetical protein